MSRGGKTKSLWKNPAYKKSMSKAHKGQQAGHKFKKGQDPWNKGLTKKTDKRVREASILQSGIKHKMTKESYPKKSEANIAKWKNHKFRSKMMKIFYSKEYREKSIKAILKGLLKRPTSYEQKIITLCEKYRLPFIYVGDGEVIINYVNPDFISTDGSKLLIEVYYTFFKIRDYKSCKIYEEKRSERFAKFGYRTLFLNEVEIEEKDWESICLKEIRKFIKNENK